MKRCSECHFTFEDHEQFCDFDGTALTRYEESRSQNILPPPASRFRRLIRSRVSLAVLALGGIVSSALLIGYYDSASEANVDNALNPETRTEVLSPAPPGEVPVQSTTQSQSNATRDRRIANVKRFSPIARQVAIASHTRARVRLSATRKETRSFDKETRASEIPRAKSESKVTVMLKKTGSILKKTVGILKKPFE